MKLKEAKEQLNSVKKYFPFSEIEIKAKGLRNFIHIAEVSRGNIVRREPLEKYSDLMSLVLYCYRSIIHEEGREGGIIEGKLIRSREFTELLGLSGIKEDIRTLEITVNHMAE